MASFFSSLIPILVTAIFLAALMALTMGIGWVSGKLLKKILGIGGKKEYGNISANIRR